MSDSELVKGTSIVAIAGVFFDLWVSLFMADKPNEHVVRIVTSVFVVVLLYGLWLMYTGWKTDQNKN